MPTPTIKWKAYDGGNNGLFLLGMTSSSPSRAEFLPGRQLHETSAIRDLALKTAGDLRRVRLHQTSCCNNGRGQFAIEQPMTRPAGSLLQPTGTRRPGSGLRGTGIIFKMTSRRPTARTRWKPSRLGRQSPDAHWVEFPLIAWTYPQKTHHAGDGAVPRLPQESCPVVSGERFSSRFAFRFRSLHILRGSFLRTLGRNPGPKPAIHRRRGLATAGQLPMSIGM